MANSKLAHTLAAVTLVLGMGCISGCGTDEGETEDMQMEVETTPRTCFPPDGLGGSPNTIEATIAHINAMPKPVTIPCFLESLDRPLSIYATWNTFSAQPAQSPIDPRIFIFIDDLALSVVTKGDSRALLEMSEVTSEARSIKAELLFPIEEELGPEAPYTRAGDGEGTPCGFCHLGVTRLDGYAYEWVYESQYVGGDKRKQVELDYLQRTWQDCDRDADPDRCWMFDSIFAHGEVLQGEFLY